MNPRFWKWTLERRIWVCLCVVCLCVWEFLYMQGQTLYISTEKPPRFFYITIQYVSLVDHIKIFAFRHINLRRWQEKLWQWRKYQKTFFATRGQTLKYILTQLTCNSVRVWGFKISTNTWLCCPLIPLNSGILQDCTAHTYWGLVIFQPHS